jgi:hypothetical protein
MEWRHMNKYRVAAKEDRTDGDGVTFHSKAEMLYAEQLRLDPEIVWVLRQVPVQLGQDHKTVVDFLVCSLLGRAVYCGAMVPLFDIEAHEVKGMVKPADRKTWKLWTKYAKFPLRVVKQSGKGFETIEMVGPS